MPRNNKNLVAKDIDGKKIREQYFDAILVGLFIVVAGYTIYSLFDIKNFLDNLLNSGILITCFSPFILLAILNKFVFGKILCVLSEDKLYYFSAETRINSRHNKTNGYLEYNEIKNVEYIPSRLGVGAKRLSRVIISGENFEITVWNANRSLVKEINKRK
ncbi:MAG: hypothetical protein IJY56_04110 [Clostridia bacterium]|nr:hypothetical protein [Clostridia bacterium]